MSSSVSSLRGGGLRSLSGFGPTCLTFDDHLRKVRRRPDLERTSFHSRMLRDQLNGMLEISRLENENSPDLFFRLGVWAIRDRRFAVLPSQGDCRTGAL